MARGILPRSRAAPKGLFGKAILKALRTMPAGTPEGTIVLEALRTATPEQLRKALDRATPEERIALFHVLPADQIGSLLASVGPATLGPAKPPPPPPSPLGGPPSTILRTTYVNVPYPPAANDPLWSRKLTGGKTIGDFSLRGPNWYEWEPVFDPDLEHEREGGLEHPLVGLTGWAVPGDGGGLSQGDVWFTHPFGFDWEFYVAPDPQYETLLAASNTGHDPATGKDDSDYTTATARAREFGLPAPKGVLGIETDQGLVPPAFRDAIEDRTRVAVFGRWIVDAGHDDFHTEIHPPLLIAAARALPAPAGVRGVSERTHVDLISRPYTVSQRFPEGNFVQHLIAEVAKTQTTIFGIPLSMRVEEHPKVLVPPYEGRPWIKLLVQPPVPRRRLALQRLMVSFHFTYRHGVAVRVYDAGNDTVGIVIVLGDTAPAHLPRKHDFTVGFSQLGSDYGYAIDALQIVDIVIDPLGAIALQRGILTDLYDAPTAASPGDVQNVAGPVGIEQLPPTAGFYEDDAQPFPIYGWVDAWWQDVEIVAE